MTDRLRIVYDNEKPFNVKVYDGDRRVPDVTNVEVWFSGGINRTLVARVSCERPALVEPQEGSVFVRFAEVGATDGEVYLGEEKFAATCRAARLKMDSKGFTEAELEFWDPEIAVAAKGWVDD